LYSGILRQDLAISVQAVATEREMHGDAFPQHPDGEKRRSFASVHFSSFFDAVFTASGENYCYQGVSLTNAVTCQCRHAQP
jgi:hypothetical protein